MTRRLRPENHDPISPTVVRCHAHRQQLLSPILISKAFDELREADPINFVHIMSACFPDMIREMIRDRLAEIGMTEDDVRELI
jgi:hypothetical protein